MRTKKATKAARAAFARRRRRLASDKEKALSKNKQLLDHIDQLNRELDTANQQVNLWKMRWKRMHQSKLTVMTRLGQVIETMRKVVKRFGDGSNL